MFLEDIYYIGVDDHEIDLFENQFPVPNGMSYNSYIIMDEKTAIIDSVDTHFTQVWLNNIRRVLGQKKPDYLIVQHMEPDHSGSILRFMEAYPEATLIASAQALVMVKNFFGVTFDGRQIIVSDKETLSLGKRTLAFMTAAMVHWPEVLMTYDRTEKVLFSADAFGKFGALDTDDGVWEKEARRYYFGIVGKYGGPVQAVLKKISGLDIQAICPLHGPMLTENPKHFIERYQIWSSYTAEEEGIVIAYTSVYGNTKKAVSNLAESLKTNSCQPIVLYDLVRCDMSEAVADAFRYSKLVLATTTYNGDIFPFMREFIDHLTKRGFSNRTIAFVENGSWAPAAARTMKGMLASCKHLTYAEPIVNILSALSEESSAQLATLADTLCKDACCEQAPDKPAQNSCMKKKFLCKICGYVYEGTELPGDFMCPLCKRGAEDFEEM